MRTRPAASRPATMPLLALNRKDTGWRIDWHMACQLPTRPMPLKTLLVWRYRGRRCDATSRNRGHVLHGLLHGLVIGTASALGRNPGNVAVRVLHVTGFAVNAILGVDLEARTRCLLDPFIDAGRAIAVGRTGIDVVLGCLLQIHIGDLEMNRLVFLVIGVGQEH